MRKIQRVVNKRAIREVQKDPCVGCGREGPSEAHHIKTKGSGGPDKLWNLLPFCHACHMKWHTEGPIKAMEGALALKVKLLSLGWEWRSGKLTNPKTLIDDSFDESIDKDPE